MAAPKATRKQNFRAARLRRKLRLRRALFDGNMLNAVSEYQCDLPGDEPEHAAGDPAGHPSPEAQEKALPEMNGATFCDARPDDDEVEHANDTHRIEGGTPSQAEGSA